MGVKSLWQLLDPVGRPVLLETMEGKAMAIDSSIWIYQFQATMRDKEGRGLVNAHLVGFLRRICKLLFYGIQPVFVFDGGAPILKMATIAERKKKKSGAAASHAKVAERLLAAQMRREALEHASGKGSDGKGKGKAPPPPGRIDENTVYLEDLTGPVPKTPAKAINAESSQVTPPSSSKKARWRDHDPYRLPEINMDAVVAKATASAAPDPRLATEDELRTFIEEMRPEDFDVNSSAFRELPTEMQYEIIGDLRLKSRQTSYKRLQSMLKVSKTPLDFSKEQIKNLKQRNNLTQQLLVTIDSIGTSHLAIPIRIASERNKEYVLVKNEGADGGWVLGIRDEGTAAKPIEIDVAPAKVEISDEEGSEEDDDDDDMEDVPITSAIDALYDPDLREFRRGQALAALASRYTPHGLAPLTTKPSKKQKRPLFVPEDDELPQLSDPEVDGEDPELALAMEESARLEEEATLRRAIEESRRVATDLSGIDKPGESSSSATRRSPEKHRSQQFQSVSDESDDEDLYASPTRLETALSIGGAGPRRPPPSKSSGPTPFPSSSLFGVPTLLLSEGPATQTAPTLPDSDEDDMEEVPVERTHFEPSGNGQLRLTSNTAQPTPELIVEDPEKQASAPPRSPISIDEEMEEVEVEVVQPAAGVKRPEARRLSTDLGLADAVARAPLNAQPPRRAEVSPALVSPPAFYASRRDDSVEQPSPPSAAASATASAQITLGTPSKPPGTILGLGPASTVSPKRTPGPDSSDSEEDPDQIPWSRSPSPTAKTNAAANGGAREEEDGWDAAQEIDPHAEEDEYTRFLSQVKGKDIDAVRREIDEEIRDLNKQKKSAMRDSEDINQQMISQIMIMLRLFGIPYITAPMEAEAQCAALLTLGLVDGIITDDSDVFLFGGARVLKNMFNQSKTVECFLLPDLERELGLDRDKLVRLAYLLGSDYTEGLPGVGPVVAMELLSEFPGHDGLHKFKAWWTKVQSGRDKADESASKFRKRFKKKFKELYLPTEWPNASVRDAYYHPTVDESTEPFKWGMPDLDALRGFLNSELGWDQPKVDELLLPIIRKMSRRAQGASAGGQGTLAGFFDVPLGANAAPRKRQAYASKRLQQVVSDFRRQQARAGEGSGTPGPASASASASASGEDVNGSGGEGEEEARPAKKRKKTSETRGRGRGKGKAVGAAATAAAGDAGAPSAAGRGRGRGATRGRGRGRGAKRASKKREKTPSDSEDEDAFEPSLAQEGAEVPGPSREELGLRPRPKPRPVRKPQNVETGGTADDGMDAE